MKVPRADVITSFDLTLDRRSLSRDRLSRLKENHTNSDLAKIYSESFEWLFYEPEPFDGSALVRVMNQAGLLGFRRFCFRPSPSNWKGSTLLLDEQHALGVYCVWQTYRPHPDPLRLKWEEFGQSDPDKRLFNRAMNELTSLGLEVADVERQYRFVAVQIDTDDLEKFCVDNATWLGELFTGNLEHERPQRLAEHIKTNISWRKYERLLMRWTEALGVYQTRVEVEDPTRLCELTLFRAVQTFETCIAVRRWLRNVAETADEVASSLAWYRPRPWKVNQVLESFSTAERDFVVAPPVQSVEADAILRKAYAAFGVPAIVEATRKSCEVLDRRYQWAKTQLLVGVGVGAFLVDKLKLINALYWYFGLSQKLGGG